jgi:hypothetical protein
MAADAAYMYDCHEAGTAEEHRDLHASYDGALEVLLAST